MTEVYARARAELDAVVAALDARPTIADRGWDAGERVDPTTHAWGDWPIGDGLFLRAWPTLAGPAFEIEVTRKRQPKVQIADIPRASVEQTVVEQVERAFGSVALTEERLVADLGARGIEAHPGAGAEVMVVAPWSAEFLVADVDRLALYHEGTRLPVDGDFVEAIARAVARPPVALEANREVHPLAIAPATAARITQMLRTWGEGPIVALLDADEPLAPAATEAELLDGFGRSEQDADHIATARAAIRVLQRGVDRTTWRGWQIATEPGSIAFAHPTHLPAAKKSVPSPGLAHWLTAWPTDAGWQVTYEAAPVGGRRYGRTMLAFEPGDGLDPDQLGVVLGAFVAEFALQCTGIGRMRGPVMPHGQAPEYYGGNHVFYQPTGADDGPIGHWRVRIGEHDWKARPVLSGHRPGGRWIDDLAQPRYEGPALVYVGSTWAGSRGLDAVVVDAAQHEAPAGWTAHLIDKSLGRTGLGCWPMAVEQFIASETPTQTKRRASRSAKRAGLTAWVPPADAARSTRAGTIDAQGSTAGAWSAGRKRKEVPMRMVLALWGMGFGVEVMERIAELADAETSKSALHRLLKQARGPGSTGWGPLGAERAGAVQASIAELVAELRAESTETDEAGCSESGGSPDPLRLADAPDDVRRFAEDLAPDFRRMLASIAEHRVHTVAELDALIDGGGAEWMLDQLAGQLVYAGIESPIARTIIGAGKKGFEWRGWSAPDARAESGGSLPAPSDREIQICVQRRQPGKAPAAPHATTERSTIRVRRRQPPVVDTTEGQL